MSTFYPSELLTQRYGTSRVGELQREAGGIMPGRYYLVSWRTGAPHPDPWSQCWSPTVNLQIKSFLGEPFMFRAGAGLGACGQPGGFH